MQMGRLDDAKSIIRSLWGPTEVDSTIEEFLSVFNEDEGDINTTWSELFEEPNYKGHISVYLKVGIIVSISSSCIFGVL